MIAERNPQVAQAVVRLRELSADERARDLYERREKARRDIAAEKKWAIKQQALEIAKNALHKKMTVDDIMDITGLTREEVENLNNAN